MLEVVFTLLPVTYAVAPALDCYGTIIGIYFIVLTPSGYFKRSSDDSTAFFISFEFLGRMNLQLELLFMILVVKNWVSWLPAPRSVVEQYFYLLILLFCIASEVVFLSRDVWFSASSYLTRGIFGGFPSILSDDFADPIPPIFCTDL